MQQLVGNQTMNTSLLDAVVSTKYTMCDSYTGSGNCPIEPRFHTTRVRWTLGLIWKLQTSAYGCWADWCEPDWTMKQYSTVTFRHILVGTSTSSARGKNKDIWILCTVQLVHNFVLHLFFEAEYYFSLISDTTTKNLDDHTQTGKMESNS